MGNTMGKRMPASILPLVDRILDGRLLEMLQGFRDDRLTYAEITHLLRTDHDIKVTDETVRKWCIELDVQDPPAKASA